MYTVCNENETSYVERIKTRHFDISLNLPYAGLCLTDSLINSIEFKTLLEAEQCCYRVNSFIGIKGHFKVAERK